MASEVGVLDIPAENILIKERLHPGRIFLVDTAQGRIVVGRRDQARAGGARSRTRSGSRRTSSTSRICRPAPYLPPPSHETVLRRQQTVRLHRTKICGCCSRRWRATAKKRSARWAPTPSLAVLSDRPRLLYDYFKQVFAQVTNPPLDAIREELVTSMESTIGPEGNLLDPRPESCRQIKIKYPVIDNDQLAKLRHVYEPAFRVDRRCRCCSTRASDGPGLERAMERAEAAAPATRSTPATRS